MKLEMKDAPGQLVAVLKPISEVGGNIVAIIHQRDTDPDCNTLGVQIVLSLPEGKLGELINLIQKQGGNILRINEQRLLYKQSVILIGHLMHTDLSDTVDRIDKTGYAEVTELSMMMPAVNERSSSRITIKAVCKEDMERALKILREVSREKSLLLIEPLEEVA